MTRYRIQIWNDLSGDKAYVHDTFATRYAAEKAAQKMCDGLPYSFDVEEEVFPDCAGMLFA
jgi:hypothetical protein